MTRYRKIPCHTTLALLTPLIAGTALNIWNLAKDHFAKTVASNSVKGSRANKETRYA